MPATNRSMRAGYDFGVLKLGALAILVFGSFTLASTAFSSEIRGSQISSANAATGESSGLFKWQVRDGRWKCVDHSGEIVEPRDVVKCERRLQVPEEYAPFVQSAVARDGDRPEATNVLFGWFGYNCDKIYLSSNRDAFNWQYRAPDVDTAKECRDIAARCQYTFVRFVNGGFCTLSRPHSGTRRPGA